MILPATTPFPLQNESAQPHALLLQRLLDPLPEVQLVPSWADDRSQPENWVRERYRASFGAHVTDFLPWLLTMRCHGQLSAVAGLQPALTRRLYLERYLEVPVEQVLAVATGTSIARNSIVEVGNLVAARRGASHLLFLLFTSVLYEAGYQWVVFTATRALRNNLHKLGFHMIELCAVDVAALPSGVRQEWGSYYDSEPIVMAGNLRDAANLIERGALYRHVATLYRPAIKQLARQFAG